MSINPSKAGYLMPAEWAPHDATWLSWPKDPETFPKTILVNVEAACAQMVEAISWGETAKIFVNDSKTRLRVEKLLENGGSNMQNVQFKMIKSTDVWVRDYAPTFLINPATKKKGAVKWIFNSWGNKYPGLLQDNLAGMEIAQDSGAEIFQPTIVLEGGSIDANGNGTLLTTEQCLLNKNRNPKLNKLQLESILSENLSINNILWLKEGIEGDDTDGHIDDIARFVSKKNILCAYSDKIDADGLTLRENYKILKSHSQFEIEKLPMPKPLIDPIEKRKLPASYANFYIANKAVLLPVFDDPADKAAISILEGFFPKREVVPIRCNELVYGYGSIHCVTQQEPSATGKLVSPATRL
ncbi:MAG: agmatine deiminase family protein [Candidatus Micrarchaeota archaeon]